MECGYCPIHGYRRVRGCRYCELDDDDDDDDDLNDALNFKDVIESTLLCL